MAQGINHTKTKIKLNKKSVKVKSNISNAMDFQFQCDKEINQNLETKNSTISKQLYLKSKKSSKFNMVANVAVNMNGKFHCTLVLLQMTQGYVHHYAINSSQHLQNLIYNRAQKNKKVFNGDTFEWQKVKTYHYITPK